MKTSVLINANPPESYNQDYWLCLKQRKAWLLQRWLKNGEPFIFFTDEGATLFISDEQELSVLFENKEKYVVRFVEDCYWIAWKEGGYYYVLCLERYFEGKDDNERFSPSAIYNEYTEKLRAAVQITLVSISETLKMPNSMTGLDIESSDRVSNCRAIYSELDKNGRVGFHMWTTSHLIHNSDLLNWYISDQI
jgi:hypothetical protein